MTNAPNLEEVCHRQQWLTIKSHAIELCGSPQGVLQYDPTFTVRTTIKKNVKVLIKKNGDVLKDALGWFERALTASTEAHPPNHGIPHAIPGYVTTFKLWAEVSSRRKGKEGGRVGWVGVEHERQATLRLRVTNLITDNFSILVTLQLLGLLANPSHNVNLNSLDS